MRPVLAKYLWKEWREQRATLGWLALALFLLAGGGMLLAPRQMVAADPILIFVSSALCLLAAMLTVGGDLLPGEVVRGRVRLLERLPAGLGAAFRAKFLFLGAIALVSMLYGASLVLVFSAIRTGALPDLVLAEGGSPASAILHGSLLFFLEFLLFFGISLWIFAASSWLPRAALALPAAAILLSLLGWPLWLILLQGDWYLPRQWEVPGFALLGLAGAPVTAWVSFTHGLRFGRSSRQAAWRGIAVAVLFVSPAWAWTGQRIHDAWSIDPMDRDFCILDCVVGEGQDFAFVTGYREDYASLDGGPLFHALVVDLATGDWRSEGEGRWMSREERSSGNYLHSIESGADDVWFWGESSQRRFDPRTGESLSTSSVPGADGSPRIADELGLGPDWHVTSWAGFGYRMWRKGDSGSGERGFHDPLRSANFSISELFPGREPGYVLVRSGRWLYLDRPSGTWHLLDPETGEREPARGLDGAHLNSALMSDGRLLVFGDDGAALVDPETGSREGFSLDTSSCGDLLAIGSPRGNGRPAGSVVSVLGDRWSTLAHFDPSSKDLRLARRDGTGRGSVWFLGSLDEDTALVVDDDRLVRLYFDGRDPEVLFPRVDL
jgi:hypothetical protein